MLRAFLFSAAVLLSAAASAQQAASLKSFPAADGLPVGVVQSDVAGQWIVIGPGFIPIQPQLLDGGKTAMWTGPAGSYLAYQIVPNEQPRPASVVLGGKVGPDPKPKPQPDPKPKPKPDPKPTPAKPYAVIVYESSQKQSPIEAELINGQRLLDAFRAAGWVDDGLPTIRRIDKDAKRGTMTDDEWQWIDGARQAAIASGKPLPLIVVGADGETKPRAIESLQWTVEAQVARCREIGGGK